MGEGGGVGGCLETINKKEVRRRTTQESREILTVTAHAHREAFLKAAVLATIAMVFGHFAVLAAAARVPQLLPDGSLEEALAALAADGAVVATCVNS